ncbi:hypothetical protein AMATHDRAFT_52713 [Amanita thiersii Skay4041]|uniref:Protein byr4 n=1 Tax=Amanita thiersii Skay4041 TaxID=703135 RepID=A0A2A9P1T3_9AGAR|nr:hypothetical protein AMATHDRAFT_52713 [Amanita thiersii Skay4041]
MATIPAPTSTLSREEWPDADFDIPEGVPLDAPSDKEDDEINEDWDLEFNLGRTGGAKAKAVVTSMVSRSESVARSSTQTFIIRPPIQGVETITDEDDEGVSTIKATSTVKATAFHSQATGHHPSTIEEDFEDAFDLPSDLTQLSLAPQTLSHRASKNSLEWGDKDQTSSSQSSDAYSSLGFADADPSNSNSSASSVSLPETETEDEEEDDLEGLIIPPAIFDSGQGVRQLTKLLEIKKNASYPSNQVKVAISDPEDDFEMGLLIDDDVDLSPSRLLCNTQQQSQRQINCSTSMAPNRSTGLRASSRMRSERPKSPINPPLASARQLQKLRLSPSPPLSIGPVRSQNILAIPPSPSPNLLTPKAVSLRGQKSHSGLKPSSPPSSRRLTRKASLSSLIECSHVLDVDMSANAGPSRSARYEEPTAASRAKTHKNTTSRIYDMKIPPTRPSTPSSNPTALRLTMPTQSRVKSRPALSSVFGSSNHYESLPVPPRPPSSQSKTSSKQLTPHQQAGPKILRRPKRPRTYGDGTELDGIADLPTDREKEIIYHVQPKGYGNRIPGASYSSVVKSDKGNARRKGKDTTEEHTNMVTPPVHVLRRKPTRINTSSSAKTSDVLPKKKRPNTQTRRKPTLIRNLGGTNAPKVVGDMRWNPQTLRWEGNDQVLRDFDVAIGTSTRPALITHLTGSSIGSPVGSFASGARRVGNMIFDPTRMCWISTLPPEEDEPDVFANLADDEEDSDCWESKGDTIRVGVAQRTPSNTSTVNSSVSSSQELPSPTNTHSRTISESGSDRGSRASLVVCDISEAFIERCRSAEERHRTEMKGWKTLLSNHDSFLRPDRSYLYEIRALATRNY